MLAMTMIDWTMLSSLIRFCKELIRKNILKCINLIDLIADFSIEQEKKRGESVEDIQKRIFQTKQKKSKYKSYMSGNKGQDKQQQEEDDDADN